MRATNLPMDICLVDMRNCYQPEEHSEENRRRKGRTIGPRQIVIAMIDNALCHLASKAFLASFPLSDNKSSSLGNGGYIQQQEKKRRIRESS